MWPFKKEPERPNKLKPGQSWCLTSGVAGSVWYYGEACDLCGKEFEFSVHIPGPIISFGYNHHDFGKYKPRRIWFCNEHSDKEIEALIKKNDT